MAEIKDWSSTAGPTDEWDKGTQEYLGGQKLDIGAFPDIPSLRAFMSKAEKDMTASIGTGNESVKEKDHQVTMRDGAKIPVRTYHPEKPPSSGSPLIVVYHGGGYCIGGLETEELLCRNVVREFGAVAVNIDYRMGPEHKFPACQIDSYDATKWAAENASSLGADPSKGFIIGGTSAGGNITAVVAHFAKDEKLSPPITGCLYMIPAVCDSAVMPDKYKSEAKSIEQNKDAPILSLKAMELFMQNYITAEDKPNPVFSPLLWKSGHGGLPPSVFQICGADPLRDEALIYERILREDEGIKTKVYMYPGLPHGFWSVLPQLDSSKKFVKDSVDGVQWLLEQK